MKRIITILMLLLIAAAITFADSESLFTIGGTTDGYIIGGKEDGTLTAGQDINIGVGPFSMDLCADWTKTLWDGGNVIDLSYTLGYSQSFGRFSPKIEFTGDKSYDVEGKLWSGDLFSDLMPSLNINLDPFGVDLYSDMSFEPGYDLLQTVDTSAYANWGPAAFRAGFLYMDAQAVSDDVGYPNAPAAREGYSFYVKASVSY